MSIQDKINTIEQSKTDIENSIKSMGGNVPEGAMLADLPQAVESIPVGTQVMVDGSPVAVFNADTKADVETSRTITSTAAAAGVTLVDNDAVTISGTTTFITVTASSGTGTISLVAGATLSVTLPSGQGFSGLTPTSGTTYELEITEGLIYNMVYFKGTYYIDGGR